LASGATANPDMCSRQALLNGVIASVLLCIISATFF
jgi:hypothetical protein